MFNKKTVFIVGAGASKEVGLPTGTELMVRIASKLDLRFNANDPELHSTGDVSIRNALRDEANKSRVPLNDYFSEALKIRNGMSTALSIDNFIHSHSANEKLVLCAKLGIAQTILEAEGQSDLAIGDTTGQRQLINHSKVQGKWYLPLFQKFMKTSSLTV